MEQRLEPWAAADFADALDRADAVASGPLPVRIRISTPGSSREERRAAPRADFAVVGGTDVLLESYVRDLDEAQQLANDVDDIAQARDALLTSPGAHAQSRQAPQEASHEAPGRQQVVWLPMALNRTADSVPIILGSTLGFLMVLVFTTAAVFVKLAR